MGCPLCESDVELRSTVHTLSRPSYHLMIYDLPVRMCRRCGQALYTEAQADALEHLIQQTDEAVTALIRVSASALPASAAG